MRLNGGKYGQMAFQTQENLHIRSPDGCEGNSVPSTVVRGYDFHKPGGYLGYVGSGVLLGILVTQFISLAAMINGLKHKLA